MIYNNINVTHVFVIVSICAQPLELHGPLQKQPDTIYVISTVPKDIYKPDLMKITKLIFFFLIIG